MRRSPNTTSVTGWMMVSAHGGLFGETEILRRVLWKEPQERPHRFPPTTDRELPGDWPGAIVRISASASRRSSAKKRRLDPAMPRGCLTSLYLRLRSCSAESHYVRRHVRSGRLPLIATLPYPKRCCHSLLFLLLCRPH